MASALAAQHILAQARIRRALVRAVEASWAALPAYNEEQVEPFLAVTVPLVLAAQRRATALTDAYLARVLDRQPLGINPAETTGPAVRNGTPPREVYRRPFVTVWTALAAQTPWEQAVASGLARASGTAAMDAQLAHRAAYGAVQDRDDRIRGYKRAADGNACTFCQTVDGAFVKSASAAALHNGCGCGLEVVLHDVAPSPVPETVAVNEHGELGAVLGDPAHAFAGPEVLT